MREDAEDRRLTLAEIADERGRSVEALAAEVEVAITAFRSGR